MASPSATASVPHTEELLPTRWQAARFFVRASGLRLLRSVREVAGVRPRRFGRSEAPASSTVLAESRGRLYASDTPAEFALQAGKVQNLRLAASCINNLAVPAGEVFSFWAHIPRPSRRLGYAEGRELREGCLIPSVGGGLCQLSNALYDAALTAGFEIVERHAHSRNVPGSMAAAGRDATVFWNYVDLRFRASQAWRIEAFLTRDELVIRLLTLAPATGPAPVPAIPDHDRVPDGLPVESCETCGVDTCFRHPTRSQMSRAGITAWLVDGWWPEFDAYLQATADARDELFLPLDGARFYLRSYRWHTARFRRVRHAPLETLHRAWASRRLASQGAARQRTLLRFDAALAARYARTLPPAATHLVVSQNLLPFLWRAGVLGGRSFEVLMTRLPMSALQQTLDRAAALHSESATLADFRVDAALIEAEDAALAEAVHWITPHHAIARLAGSKARTLSWQIPAADSAQLTPSSHGRRTVFFPASTLGRKGAYELRGAARELALQVILGGPVLEAADFWRGVETRRTETSFPGDVRAVVLPAWVEHQPRRLLRAAAMGIPVVASDACGLGDSPGVTTVAAGDVSALIHALKIVEKPART